MDGYSLGGCSGLLISHLPRQTGGGGRNCLIGTFNFKFLLGKWVWLNQQIHSARSILAYSIKIGGGASGMTNHGKVLATKPSVPETHSIEERTKPTPKKYPLTAIHVFTHTK